MPVSKLTIVIPVHSGIKQLGQCLSALHSSQYQNFSVIVVDHGETDDVSRFITKDFPGAVCLRGSPALWWSGATNLGIKHALANDSQLIMLLNHDCFVRPDTINQLLDAPGLSDTAIITPVQNDLQTGKKIVRAHSCILLGFPTLMLPSFFPGPNKQKRVVETSLIIGGRGAIIPANIFLTNGLFDEERFPHYGADHDFYFRCKKDGIRLYVNQDAIVDIDNTSNSSAAQLGRLTFPQFYQTLLDRKSHRNIYTLNSLYQNHYPIKYLHLIGLALNILRYFIVYLWARLAAR